MGQAYGLRRFLVGMVLVALGAVGCTVSDVKAPELQGPSELALSLAMTARPDILPLDGASLARITVEARDEYGRPKGDVRFRAEINVGGTIVDCGSLSAKTLVTGNDGRALLTYTAPAFACSASTDQVTIVVTPFGTDIANAVSRTVHIRLVVAGDALPGAPTPRFTINGSEAAITLQPYTEAQFDASASTPAPGSAIGSYSWNFGDGGTATGVQAFHKFSPGTYFVMLTATSTAGVAATLSRQITVNQGVNPTASFVYSPQSPVVNQSVLFNGSTSVASAGRTLVDWDWDFGNGAHAGGLTASTSYALAGTYTVVLTVTDDVGQEGLQTKTIAVGAGTPITATFTFSPTNPTVGGTVFFNASASSSPNGAIVSYQWDFGDSSTPTTTTTPLANHAYGLARTYVVRLTVTDSTGATATTTLNVTVG